MRVMADLSPNYAQSKNIWHATTRRHEDDRTLRIADKSIEIAIGIGIEIDS
ncbi:hypothetical protein Dret_0359 [Desulfohalobium retbaense DSM 5692]|uniref:Uncharacterized protein n=1 Tax=Desulfohalobium retbaense (strain ATCC 49708 / DSM 5692 / JCM 16813 / HR100) TaxID=485915 RepID=C8X036_DESRD|nr:hypothetical protein Dret_0359 [Desulfohalobium retbaense DSM 5692]